MKNEELYNEYKNWLDWRLDQNQINRGKYSLLKMSRSAFDEFKIKLENDETFNEKIVEIMKTENRDKKIDDIFDGFN
jgi:hypothetical protein